MGWCRAARVGQGACGPSASLSPCVPAVLASPTRWSKAPRHLPWLVTPPRASAPLCCLSPKPEQRGWLGVNPEAASEAGLTRASGSPDCFIGGLRPRALRLEGLPWSAVTLRAPTSPAACYEGKVFVFTYASLYLSTGGGQWGKPPESAEWGLCQAALLPPHTPKPSLFQEIGT